MADQLIREASSFQSTPLVPVPQYWDGSSYQKIQGTAGAMYVAVTAGTITVSGTVTASGSVTASGTVAVSSGTVTVTAGTVSVTGTVTASGTVAVSSGTVAVTSGTVSVTGSVTASGTVSVSSGTVTVSSGTVTVASGTVSVTGTVTASGTVAVSSGTVTVASGTVSVTAGTVTSNIATVPVVGSQGNAWNAASVNAAGTSSAVDCQYQRTVSAFGNVSAATTVSAYVSQDNTNFYGAGVNAVTSGADDFHLSFTTAARYVRLQSSGTATITATIAGK